MQVQGLRMLETLTAKYAPELKEVPVVAIVGLPAIKSSVVELDLRKGLLRTLGMASEEAREQEFDYQAKSYGIVLDGDRSHRDIAQGPGGHAERGLGPRFVPAEGRPRGR